MKLNNTWTVFSLFIKLKSKLWMKQVIQNAVGEDEMWLLH